MEDQLYVWPSAKLPCERSDMFKQHRQLLNKLLVQHDHLQSQKLEEEQHLAAAKEHAEQVLAAQQLVQIVAQEVQQRAHQQIAALVTHCLRAVFGEEAYTFKIDFERKRGKTAARLLLVRGDLEIDTLDAAGGGVVDVVGFALRLATLLLSRPKRRQFLCLDEPFKMVSREYIPKIRDLLLALSHDLGVQIVLVTHNAELNAGKVIEL